MAKEKIWITWLPSGEGAPSPAAVVTGLQKYGSASFQKNTRYLTFFYRALIPKNILTTAWLIPWMPCSTMGLAIWKPRLPGI